MMLPVLAQAAHPFVPEDPAFARAGGIYTVNEWLDVDAGVQARLNRAASSTALLAGATLSW